MNKVKVITNDLIEDNYTKRILFRLFIGILITLSIFYVYLIGSITFNVLARKSLENTVRIAGNNISELELTYLNNTNEINKNYAMSLGFVDTQENLFATRAKAYVAIR